MPSFHKSMFANIDPKCSKHSAQLPSALSSTILDYYHNYGRNRDLEKYLRFRNRSSSGSSSIHISPTDESRVGKSLENINILESCLEPEKSVQKSKSSESLKNCGLSKLGGAMAKDDSEDGLTANNQIKLTSNKAVKSKKKYNINMDTCIEITLPQQLSQPSHQHQTSIPFNPSIQHDFSQQKIEFETSETQTERVEFPKTPNRSEFDVADIPPRPSSVASSAASISNKQRLEWDSMADVGYNKSAASSNFTNLTEFERKVLKKFFASHGVNFTDEMVVIASTSKRSTSVPELTKQVEKGRIKEKWDVAFQKILEEKYAKRNGKTKVKVDQKRLWQSALMKFREKYGTNINPESDLCITDPVVHSTPILADASKGAIPKVKSKISDTKDQREEIAVKGTIEQMEKACQTSMIATSSKECQVDDSTVSDEIIVPDYQDMTSTDNSKESEKSIDCKGGLISATSFEFFAPDTYNCQDKENIPPWNKVNVFPQEQNKIGKQDENKENIPPKVIDNEEIVQNFNLSTPKNTTTDQLSSGRTDEIFGEISNLENDLTRGVEILFSLADSTELTEEKKKKLVRKMIRRMTTAKYKDSTASSDSIISSERVETLSSESTKSKSVIKTNLKQNISGVNTLSSSSSSNSRKESSLSSAKMKLSEKQNNAKENSIKDWLKPITNSELEHERIKTKEKNENDHRLSKSSLQSDESKADSNILKYVENQRKSHFEWIDNEICNLVNLKEYLQKKRSETDIIKLDLSRKEINSARTDQSKKSGVIYENVTVRPKSAKDIYAEVQTACVFKNGKLTSVNSKSKECATKQITRSPIERDVISNTSSSLEWNSHINMQQFVRNRKKMQTPNEDITSYAHAKQKEFIGKYESIRTRPIYTQPYTHSSDHSDGHYSEPHDNDRKTSSKKNTNDAYTSITGSDGFLSSDSVSIPVANSTSNTTTHQYDTRASVAIQTSSSLTRTAPIFKAKASCNCGTICNCLNARRPTIRVKYQTNDKNLQVLPKAISYDITFDETKQKNESRDQWDDNRNKMENYFRHSDTSSASSSKDCNKKSEKNFIGNFGGCAKLSLQDHLKSARPDFVSQADERRKCLIELHNLREKRNEQRNRLFLLSSNQSLRNHIKTLNPTIVAKRIFTTKALKQQTRNRYNKLPEIVRKEEIDRQNRIKRSNRIVRDMFNKNLQTRVLKGQTDLSNSVSVAAI